MCFFTKIYILNPPYAHAQTVVVRCILMVQLDFAFYIILHLTYIYAFYAHDVSFQLPIIKQATLTHVGTTFQNCFPFA